MRFYYRNTDVWAMADEVREKYGAGKFPVDPEHIWEISLGKEIRPARGLVRKGTEAMLYGDLNTIAVDESKFDNPVYRYRIRFSIAHEIGHFFLHCQNGNCPRFNSVEDWYEYYDNLDDDDYWFLKNHANQFAGRLLVPRDKLIQELQTTWDNLPEFLNKNDIRTPEAVNYFPNRFHRNFDVSAECVTKRLQHEDLWPPEKFDR